MYRTVAPAPAPAPALAPAPAAAAGGVGPVRELPVRLEAICARSFRAGRPLRDEGLARYFADVAAAFGREYDGTVLARARTTSYTAMAAELLAALAPRVGPVEHVVLANATPDLDCRASVGCFLVEAAGAGTGQGATAGGGIIAFGVSDQGRAAAFTALRVAADLRRGAPPGRTAVFVFDQSTVPWEVGRRELMPDRDAAVALVCRPAEPGRGVLFCQRTAVPPAQVPDRLSEYLRVVAGRYRDGLTLVAGGQVPLTPAVRAQAGEVRRAPRGQFCTAVWAGAHETACRHAPGATVIVEYDPDLEYLCMAAVDAGVVAC